MIASPSRPERGQNADPLDLERASAASVALFDDARSGRRVSGDDDAAAVPLTDAAERCIIRFAAHEADLTSAELAGLGRVSSVRFPRLGGVLFGRVAPGGPAAALLITGAARTLRVGYRATVATDRAAGRPTAPREVDELWDAFLAASYRVPRPVAASVWEIGRFDELWVDLLVTLGLDGDATRFAKGRPSLLSRSIRGLSTVGVALALSEHDGLHDRFAARRRTTRGRLRAGGGLPAAPRTILDDPD